MERSLNEIALQAGTDKSDQYHGYARLYERYLAPHRHRPITLLEIGVADGASMRMWREYFPQARVYGLDRDPRCRACSGGVEVFIGDQSDPVFLADVIRRIGAPDLIIDDGSHIGEHQISSLESLFPALREEGLYVIEDLHTAYWNWGARSAVAYLQALVDAVMISGRSPCGEIRNDPNYAQLCQQLNYFERSVESIHFYRSIAFLRKRRGSELPAGSAVAKEHAIGAGGGRTADPEGCCAA